MGRTIVLIAGLLMASCGSGDKSVDESDRSSDAVATALIKRTAIEDQSNMVSAQASVAELSPEGGGKTNDAGAKENLKPPVSPTETSMLAREPENAWVVPVMIPAGDGQMANCSGGVVAGLNPKGDGFLAVRAGPGTNHPMLDRIHNGKEVEVCDQRGTWVGIVYSDKGYCNNNDGASPKAWPYSGPCRSGWVDGRWITHVAG